jgi:uncharacterized membrane protein
VQAKLVPFFLSQNCQVDLQSVINLLIQTPFITSNSQVIKLSSILTPINFALPITSSNHDSAPTHSIQQKKKKSVMAQMASKVKNMPYSFRVDWDGDIPFEKC